MGISLAFGSVRQGYAIEDCFLGGDRPAFHLREKSGRARQRRCGAPCSAWTGEARPSPRKLPHNKSYCLEVEAPAARSRRTPRKPAAARSSGSASRSMVAARCGDSGRKRTLSRLWPREVIRVLITGGSSCLHWVQVVNTTGPGRTTVQLRDFRTSLLSL